MHVFSLVKIINNFITKLKSELTFKIFINIFVIYLCTNKFQNVFCFCFLWHTLTYMWSVKEKNRYKNRYSKHRILIAYIATCINFVFSFAKTINLLVLVYKRYYIYQCGLFSLLILE